MRLLGLDVGDRTIGVAVSDLLGITAQGLGVIKRGNLNVDLNGLRSIIEEYEVEEIIVGFPRALDGSIGPQARKVSEFVVLLENQGWKVKLWDERFSTKAAERYLIQANVRRSKRRQVIDQVAAALILQNYLDNKRGPGAAFREHPGGSG